MNQKSAVDIVQHFNLDGKVSLVSGASRGIGKAMAEGLAGAGSNLVIAGREAATLKPVAEEIVNQTGMKVVPIQADISNLDEIDSLVKKTVDTFGKLDVLVNNAGVNIRNQALDFTEPEWDFVTDINLKGAFFLAQACGNVMQEQKSGKVINTLSLTSAIGLPTSVAYTAAKGGLLQLTKLLAVEWAEYNIQVNGIAPGFIRTEMTAPAREDKRNEWILNRTPADRWGEPEDLAGLTIFFASNASDFVTGQMVFVDGGFMAGSDWRKNT